MGALFDAIRAGDQAAIAELDRLAREIARRVCRGGGPAGVADLNSRDVAREAVRTLLEVGIEQNPDVDSEREYIGGVVKVIVIRRSRVARRRRSRESATTAPQLGVVRTLERISPECRGLIAGVLFNDRPCAELATEAEETETALRDKLSRCIRQAREQAPADAS
jgi:hypothetical protein